MSVQDINLPQLPTDREAFLEALEHALMRSHEHDSPITIAVLDVDLLGRVNDSLGRATGEAVLDELARKLREAFSERAFVWRYGGDAWSLLWEGMEKEQVFLSLERFREALAAKPFGSLGVGKEHTITISAGLATSPDDGTRPQDLINKAHEALYRAKVAGRNRICLAREEKMVTKTSYYTQGQLMGLRRLAERMGIKDAELLREAVNDLLLKHNA